MNITNTTLNNLQLNIIKLSAQDKIDETNNSSDNMIYDSLNSDMLQSQQEILNFNDAVGYMQIADGALSNISEQTTELHTLSVASNNAILNSDQKSTIYSQMQDIQQNIDQTISQTTYNGKNVFNSDFNIGSLNVNLNFDTSSLDVTDQKSIETFQKQINSIRSDIGSFMNSSNESIDSLSAKVVNEANSKSNYEVDIAKTINEMKKDELNLDASMIASSHNTDILSNSIKSLLS
jgi:flagellin